MTVKGCPSREQMLAAGTAPPVKGSTLNFACVCWQPYGVTPIVKAGAGPAGPGCFTVRAEVTPGAFTFIENVPTWGERRHEINRSDYSLGAFDGPWHLPVRGSLDLQTARTLVWGVPLTEGVPRAPLSPQGWNPTVGSRLLWAASDCWRMTADRYRVSRPPSPKERSSAGWRSPESGYLRTVRCSAMTRSRASTLMSYMDTARFARLI